jgi:hypothetical protein
MNRILFVGWGRAGKDAGAEYLGSISTIPYAGSTSWAAKELVAKILGIHPQVAWETRHQRRMEWKQICDDLRKNDPLRLIGIALWHSGSKGRGIIAGCRDKIELDAARREKVFDRIVWISRPGIPYDPTVTFGPQDCDDTLCNSGTLEEYHAKLRDWAIENGILRPAAPPIPTTDLIRE